MQIQHILRHGRFQARRDTKKLSASSPEKDAARLPKGLKTAFNTLMLNALNLHIRIKMPIFVCEVERFVWNMGKDMIIKMLQDQLEAANAVNLQLNMTVSNLNATVSVLRA